MGADSGHHEHRSPSTRAATDARGWRPTFRRSIARLVPQPGQNTSSHGVPAISAARIVGDQSMSPAGDKLLVPGIDDGLRLGACRGRMLRRHPLLKVHIREQLSRPRIHAPRSCLHKSRRHRIIFAIDCQETFFSSLLATFRRLTANGCGVCSPRRRRAIGACARSVGPPLVNRMSLNYGDCDR